MLCQNCGKNEVNFRYTQIINGVKKEMSLCDKCAKELGVEGLEFSMPINFSSFFSDFFNDTEGILPNFAKTSISQCNKCGTTFEDFIHDGEFGCGNCYITFSDRITPILKNLHGSSKHIGRGYKESIDELEYNKNQFEKSQKEKSKIENKVEKKTENKESQEENKIKTLQKDLQKAIKEERYEDAAKIRDNIKELEEKNDKKQ